VQKPREKIFAFGAGRNGGGSEEDRQYQTDYKKSQRPDREKGGPGRMYSTVGGSKRKAVYVENRPNSSPQ